MNITIISSKDTSLTEMDTIIDTLMNIFGDDERHLFNTIKNMDSIIDGTEMDVINEWSQFISTSSDLVIAIPNQKCSFDSDTLYQISIAKNYKKPILIFEFNSDRSIINKILKSEKRDD